MTEPELYHLFRNCHMVAGAAALIMFWAQIARRKGGSSHIRWGWAYNISMIGVLATALPMIVITWRNEQPQIALFLGFLSVITLTAGTEGFLASRNRQSGAWVSGPLMTSVTMLIAAYSVLLIVLFFQTGAFILLVMAGVGLHATFDHFRKLRSGKPYSWIGSHINGMLGTGIAVHIAFLAFGLRNIVEGGGAFTIFAFVAPLIGFQFLGAYFHRRFPRRSETTSSVALEEVAG